MFKENNKARDELIHDIVDSWTGDGIEWTWQDIANEVYICLGITISDNACRKSYKRYCGKDNISKQIKQIEKEHIDEKLKGMKHNFSFEDNISEYESNATGFKNLSYEEVIDKIAPSENDAKILKELGKDYTKLDKPKPKQVEPISMERKKDGTLISERKVILSETDMKDDKCVLLAHGFDPDKYDVISIKNKLSVWDNGNKEGTELQSYQSSLTVKPKSSNSELSKKDIDELVKNFKPIDNNFKLIKGKEDLAIEIDFSDLHIGSLSWHQEVGEDNDYKIAFNTVKRQVEQAREIIELYNVGKVYLCFLGDFLQCDNIEGTTTKGTVVDTDSRSKKMVNKGMEIAMYIIENLAIAETEVIWIEGNHSRLVEYTLFQSLPYIYLHAKHIKFDVSPRIRKVFTFGDNLIGLHHGEMKKDQMFNWLQSEYRTLWGLSKYAETHSGHFHQESVVEKGGIINRTNPTPKIQDAYEYENGWKSEKTSIAYLWSLHNKLKGQFYLR